MFYEKCLLRELDSRFFQFLTTKKRVLITNTDSPLNPLIQQSFSQCPPQSIPQSPLQSIPRSPPQSLPVNPPQNLSRLQNPFTSHSVSSRQHSTDVFAQFFFPPRTFHHSTQHHDDHPLSSPDIPSSIEPYFTVFEHMNTGMTHTNAGLDPANNIYDYIRSLWKPPPLRSFPRLPPLPVLPKVFPQPVPKQPQVSTEKNKTKKTNPEQKPVIRSDEETEREGKSRANEKNQQTGKKKQKEDEKERERKQEEEGEEEEGEGRESEGGEGNQKRKGKNAQKKRKKHKRKRKGKR